MTDEEILKGLYDNTILGKAPEVKNLTQAGLDQKLDPVTMLYQALLPALQEVGRRFEVGDFFVPEMLMSARAMQAALNLLRPLLAAAGEKTLGKIVMGTVKGDVHDIAKNLSTTMPMIKVNIEALKKAGLRDSVKVMCGGAPVTAHYAEICGADAYCPDASATARKAKELIGAAGDAPGGALAEAVAAVEKMMSAAEE